MMRYNQQPNCVSWGWHHGGESQDDKGQEGRPALVNHPGFPSTTDSSCQWEQPDLPFTTPMDAESAGCDWGNLGLPLLRVPFTAPSGEFSTSVTQEECRV